MAARRRRKTTEAAAPAEDFQLSGKPLRLISWEAQNIMRIKAAYVDVSGKHVVLIAGRNGQGKSSLLKALEMGFAGKRSFPLEPIHKGASAATIRIKLSELSIDLTIDHSGNRLYVSDASGARIKSPQALLNTLFSELSFDPLRFAYMPPKEQDAELKRIGGLEDHWTKLDAEKDRVFAERTEVNRDVARYTAQLEGMPWHDDAPEHERSAKEVLDELNALLEQDRESERARRAEQLRIEDDLRAHEREAERIREQAERAAEAVKTSVDAITEKELVIENLERKLAEAKAELAHARTEHKALLATERAAVEAAEALPDLTGKRAELAALTEQKPEENPAVTAKRTELETLEKDNQKVRENAARARVKKQLDEVEAESKAKTARLKAIEDEKAQLLADASFPIDGLGFGDNGPTFNGVPLEQISRSELIRLSCAIGFAQNPKLKLLIVKDAAFLDEDGMRLMEELAEEHDGLVILERVGTQDPMAIVIEDGCVRDEATAAE